MTSPRLFDAPLVGLYRVKVDEANDLLTEWGHKLGPCRRPFYSEAFALEQAGEPVAVAISASIVNGPVAGYERTQVVELARLAAGNGWANRVMLRLWRETCAQLWPCWPVAAAVSYQHAVMHTGNLYRFDGWTLAKTGCGSTGGGSWSTRKNPDDPARGPKNLWLWNYDA